jgi:hypothetical protein
MSEALPDFICPLVLERLRSQKPERVYRSRFRSLTFKAPIRTPLEQLAEVHLSVPRELDPKYTSVMTLMFDLPTILVARSASVIDWTNPKKRLPGGGLKLFRARVESSNGDRIDTALAVGECFWGTGSHPAVITGGLFLDRGATLVVHCCPRIPDVEVDLGFWTVEDLGLRPPYATYPPSF